MRPSRARDLAGCCLVLVAVLPACRARHEGPGTIVGARVDAAVIEARASRQRAARESAGPALRDKQILFGDLHVHTTFSIDAFALSLPILQGEGAHPPADACDFARYCSALDFWSINDHAEGLTPEHWRETKESVRRCNELAGDSDDPDVVAYLGWEWSQIGDTAATHYGHKNVVLRDLADADVPVRPIASPPRMLEPFVEQRSLWDQLKVPLLDFRNRQRYLDFGRFQRELRDVAPCPRGVHVRALPPDCHEVAETPTELFEKLRQWDLESIVIPHGTTWGLYSPPGSDIARQLVRGGHDPARQTLFEIYSGHGNSEEYRDWTPLEVDADGEAVCPEPRADYSPCCWQAGEIVRARCGGVADEECEQRVTAARRNYVRAGRAGHVTVPGASIADWKDCGQCRDCFNPAFNPRPRSSAQYALAIGDFTARRGPTRFRFGFIGSSDVHSARPGTGYKEYDRIRMTEASGAISPEWRTRLIGEDPPVSAVSVPLDPKQTELPMGRLWEAERQASFFLTGGLVGAHAAGRDRDSIWRALERREVYATSGDRILLWFDMVGTHRGDLPMGSEVVLKGTPKFRVRAVGAFEQLPGCPDYARSALPPERLERLCRGECYNPATERRHISRIEVVRIRPQIAADETIADLIEDPWRTFSCAPDAASCAVDFADPEFAEAGRETVYYVRAIQEATPAINAQGLRCERDAEGDCAAVAPCYGDWRTPADDDCLAPNEERAWSSPIFVVPARRPPGA